jgi:hypothetical protein
MSAKHFTDEWRVEESPINDEAYVWTGPPKEGVVFFNVPSIHVAREIVGMKMENKRLREALQKMCDWHEKQATWDKGDNGYYESKKALVK